MIKLSIEVTKNEKDKALAQAVEITKNAARGGDVRAPELMLKKIYDAIIQIKAEIEYAE